jgi:hypothetical protein
MQTALASGLLSGAWTLALAPSNRPASRQIPTNVVPQEHDGRPLAGSSSTVHGQRGAASTAFSAPGGDAVIQDPAG